MGCDICLHSEVKINGVWHHHSEKKVKRSYPLFAKMANVRNEYEITPISEPKGIPEDATYLTKHHVNFLGGDGFSHSWLNAAEIMELHKFINDCDNPPHWFSKFFEHENMPYFMGNRFDSFLEYPEDWAGHGVEDVRYVFFFDE